MTKRAATVRERFLWAKPGPLPHGRGSERGLLNTLLGSAPLRESLTMLVRFDCPACGFSHSFDMPETTIHMTCSKTHKVLELRLTKGGDVKSRILEDDQAAAGASGR